VNDLNNADHFDFICQVENNVKEGNEQHSASKKPFSMTPILVVLSLLCSSGFFIYFILKSDFLINDQIVMDLSSLPNHIIHLCNNSQFISTTQGFSICSNKCQDARCCFLEIGHTDSCIETNSDCINYNDSCALIFQAIFSVEASERNYSSNKLLLSDLESVCSNETLINESSTEKCLEGCSAAACCFSKNESSCVTEDTEIWCDMFSPWCAFLENIL